MVSNKTLAIVALSLVFTTASYASKSEAPELKSKASSFASTAGSVVTYPFKAAGSIVAYPFKKAGNILYYSGATVVQMLKSLKPATLATLEAGKLALYFVAIVAAVYGIGAATQASYPDNYSAQFYNYANEMPKYGQ